MKTSNEKSAAKEDKKPASKTTDSKSAKSSDAKKSTDSKSAKSSDAKKTTTKK